MILIILKERVALVKSYYYVSRDLQNRSCYTRIKAKCNKASKQMSHISFPSPDQQME